MKNLKQKYQYEKSQRGYAILFAVILVSIISVIALGLSNTTYKQLVITSVAKDSQTSFYEADTASDCALYLDQQTTTLSGSSSLPMSWSCGVDTSGVNIPLTVSSSGANLYNVAPTNAIVGLPCFNIAVDKTAGATVTLIGKGYNNCDKTNFRTVERALQVSY